MFYYIRFTVQGPILRISQAVDLNVLHFGDVFCSEFCNGINRSQLKDDTNPIILQLSA